MPKKSPISGRLREARLEIGISQKQLGIAVGFDQFVTSARMNQYETGKHTPDFSVVQKIAAILKVPEAYFYAENDELAELIKVYGKISKKAQRQVVAFVKNLNM